MEVGFVEDDHRLGAAFPGDGEVALDAAEVVVGVERGDEEHGVDVRRDDLFGGVARLAGGGAGKFGFAMEHHMDVGARLAGAQAHGHPVADGRQIAAGGGRVEESARAFGGEFAVGGEEFVSVFVLERDARGHEAVGGKRQEISREEIIPAEGVEIHGNDEEPRSNDEE